MAMRSILELLGGVTRFGRLTFLGEGAPYVTGGRHIRRGRFRCDCGELRDMMPSKVRRGVYVSCGCFAAEGAKTRQTKHAGYRDPEYKSWNAMMQRCHNPKCRAFPRYGGAGILVCDEWRGDEGYRRFVAYIGPRPKGSTIDRIDNHRGYEPGNVRWATPKEQMNNRAVSRLLTFNGETMNAVDWAARLGMGKNTIDARLRKGWSVDRALTEPKHKGGGKRKRPD